MVIKSLAVIALVALPFSAAMWHKSHKHPEHFRFDVTLYKSLRVYLKDGVCGLRLLNMPTRVGGKSEFRAPLGYRPTPIQQSFLLHSSVTGPYRITWLVFPLWFTTGSLVLTAAYPVVRGPLRQWWRRAHGRCFECGYDLRGTRGRRCSECGAAIR